MTETTDRSLLADGLDRWGPPGGPPRGWRWLRLFFASIWLVYLAQPLSSLHGKHHSAGWLAAALAITVVFCVVFITVVTRWDRRPALARWGFAA